MLLHKHSEPCMKRLLCPLTAVCVSVCECVKATRVGGQCKFTAVEKRGTRTESKHKTLLSDKSFIFCGQLNYFTDCAAKTRHFFFMLLCASVGPVCLSVFSCHLIQYIIMMHLAQRYRTKHLPLQHIDGCRIKM